MEGEGGEARGGEERQMNNGEGGILIGDACGGGGGGDLLTPAFTSSPRPFVEPVAFIHHASTAAQRDPWESLQCITSALLAFATIMPLGTAHSELGAPRFETSFTCFPLLNLRPNGWRTCPDNILPSLGAS